MSKKQNPVNAVPRCRRMTRSSRPFEKEREKVSETVMQAGNAVAMFLLYIASCKLLSS